MSTTTKRDCYPLVITLMTLFLAVSTHLSALELNRYFSDNMILQRDKAVNIWGTAGKGDTITVTFAGQTASAKADESGRWVVTLDPMPANANGLEMVVSSSIKNQKSKIKNILVGDVFLFGRQSSIDVSLGATDAGRKAAGSAGETPLFRFARIKASPSRAALDNLKKDATAGWNLVDKTSALSMSAAAYYFGQDLVQDVKVPVGIVDLDMGYHFAGAWMSEQGLEKAATADLEAMGAADVQHYLQQKDQYYEVWDKRLEGYIPDKNGKRDKRGLYKKTDEPIRGFSPIELPFFPAVCYNSVIHPLRGLVVKGMLLQLGNDYPFVAFTRLDKMGKSTDMGELHTANAQSYNINKQGNRMTPTVLPAVIEDMRNSLGDAGLPVAWIMPTGSDVYQYGAHNREVRELQRRAQTGMKGVDLIVPGAEHVPMSGQPAEEALLAARCKQWILGTFYGSKSPATGPIFDRVELGDTTAIVHFKTGTAEGLTAKGDALKHFEIAGGDREFSPCKAEIEGSTIKLTNETDSEVMYVRYSWSGKPVQGLVNSAGLPAVPFNTNAEWVYEWWIEPGELDLPEEYTLPANKWPDRDYAIINYATGGKSLHLGPTGLWGSTAGPNLFITKITPGSPADGKVFEGDMVYGVDGKEFGPESDDKYKQFAAGITTAESKKGGGTLILNIRRDDELIEVPIKLEFMGSFSDTTPYDCEKSELIVKKAEAYMSNGLRPETGVPNDDTYMYGPWNDNVLFLMASGKPEHQGLVRRYIRRLADQESFSGSKGWTACYVSLLFGEYYLQTGDPSVLPTLEKVVRGSENWTPSTWPPTEPSRYGLHPAMQMPSTMGRVLAREAGVKVDPAKLNFDIRFLHDQRGENGFILYNGYAAFLPSDKGIKEPRALDSVRKAKGMTSSMNGKLGTGAALFSLLDDDYSKAVKNCSEPCVYAFNKTRTGHGGAWFNNFWTPIGAYHAGKEKFQHFMKGQQWWRELYRDHTGAVWQEHNAKDKSSVLAVGFVIHRVAHLKKLRIFGAPRSAFGPNAPAYLKPALAAHAKRDYALAEKLVKAELVGGKIPAKDMPMVKHLLESVQMVRQSIEHDLAYVEDALKRNEYYLASIELPQLKMVVAPEDDRLKTIVATLESEEGKAKIAAARNRGGGKQQSAMSAQKPQKADPFGGKTWPQVLASIDTLVKDGNKYLGRKRGRKGLDYYQEYPKDQLNLWRLEVLEAPELAPKAWEKTGFDDSKWDETPLPIIWPMAHTALLRTTLEVKDKSAYTSLYVRASAYKQQSVEVYLNGQLVAKVNNIPRQGSINFPLTPHALTVLKNGKNTLAVRAQHGKRNVNFSFRLEGRLKK